MNVVSLVAHHTPSKHAQRTAHTERLQTKRTAHSHGPWGIPARPSHQPPSHHYTQSRSATSLCAPPPTPRTRVSPKSDDDPHRPAIHDDPVSIIASKLTVCEYNGVNDFV